MAFVSRFLVCLFIAAQSTTSFKHVSIQRRKALQMSSTDVFSPSSNRIEVRTTTSDMSNTRINDVLELERTSRKEVNAIRCLSADIIGEKSVQVSSSRILQKTDGPVPRSYLPALMVIDEFAGDINTNAAAVFAIVEEGMQWYFDTGGRASRIEVSCPSEISAIVQSMGFPLAGPSEDVDVLELRALDVQDGDGRVILRCDPALFKAHCEARVQEPNANKYCLYDVIGRLAHDLGDPQGAIKPYTSALQVNSKSATTFRNMGSAYHAVGDLKLAFASYQQALQLDETDALVYLKLAFFYEEFATKDWIDAAQHAQRCYQYYLDKVDPRDTSILTRLGNLLVKEHKQVEAVDVYKKVLALEDTLSNVWFNLANAQLSIGDEEGAISSFRRSLALDPSLSTATHLLKSLSAEENSIAETVDHTYVRELFDEYAPIYDKHMKKLMYSATRVIRQELATVYRSQFGIYDGRYSSDGSISGLEPASAMEEVEGVVRPISDKAFAAGVRTQKMSDVSDFKEAQGPVGAGCSSYSSFMNKTLDILDIGCGTGGAGAWLKDYANTLVGVDLSENMVQLARKKMLYQELHVQPLNTYLQSCTKTFDLVVAADVLSYVGDLRETFQQVWKVLRPGGRFVFTVETGDSGEDLSAKGFRLLKGGRFGYSRKYMDDMAASEGTPYVTQMSREFSPRLDVGTPVPGFLYIIQKK